MAGRLEGLERPVGRIDPTKEVGEELSCKVEKDHDDEESAAAQSQVGLGNSCCCLELVELGDFAQLLVQLSVIKTSYLEMVVVCV